MATDFFAAQDAARSRSRLLVALFLASVAGLIAAIYLTLMLAFGGGVLWDPDIFLWVAGSTALVVTGASAFKILDLRAGGGRVARSLGGRPVDPSTADPDERRLVNVVEEMSIAAGVPMPEIYILDKENGINAFAAGFASDDAAVAVTRGCLTRLNREELQGVVAHEFSHILNGDMRLNIKLIGLVFGLLAISIVGQGILRTAFHSRGNRNKEGAAVVLGLAAIGIILMVAGWLGVLFGRLLQSAVSRQREFLADAAAVQFTRNPGGLSNALRKIGSAGSRVHHEHSQDVAHLFFASGLRSGWAGLFATHPPLAERIRALDPAWDGTMLKMPPPERAEASQNPQPPSLPATAAGLIAISQLARAQAIHEDLERRFGTEWREPSRARDLVLSLLPGGSQEHLGMDDRLALAELLMPQLDRLPDEDCRELATRLDHLLHTEDGLTFTEFGLAWIFHRHLQRRKQPAATAKHPPLPARRVAADLSIVLALLARRNPDKGDAAQNFRKAAGASPSFAGLLHYPDGDGPEAAQLDNAFTRLAGTRFGLRQEMIDAAARVLASDEGQTPEDDGLLRLLALILDCPSPELAGQEPG